MEQAMNTALRAAILVTAPMLLLCARPASLATDGVRAIVDIEVKENRVDGCTGCGCVVPGGFEAGRRAEAWLTFGSVKPADGGRWGAVSAASQCGRGTFASISADFQRTVGTPYLIADVAVTPAGSTPDGPQSKVQIGVQRLTGIDAGGRATYSRRTDERVLAIGRDGEVAVPLLIGGAREAEAFGLQELMLRLGVSALAREARSYGSVAVTSDVPGARVLLDGGDVGRVVEGAPLRLDNVLTGDREVRVEDYSGRSAHRTVRVVEGRTAGADLPVLNLGSGATAGGLRPVGKNPQGFEEYWRAKDGALVVRIPAGDFLMGSPEGRGDANERPQHKVRVSEFLIDKTEVTWRQMRKFHAATGDPLPQAPVSGTSDDFPVSFVVWDTAAAYCRWVGGRLPTEAEWEKAARGTDGRDYPWGDTWEAGRCNLEAGGLHQVEDIGSYPACLSPYGTLDQAGGMWEWCADWYAPDSYAHSPARDPKGPETGTQRVKRGGAWMSQPKWARTAYRDKGAPVSPNADHGFRCAQEAPAR
jgi:formylglycine-generating enzyme required for sulfatase activity